MGIPFNKKISCNICLLYLHLGLLVLSSFPAYTQINTDIERLLPKKGTILSTINSILQDQNGFLWLATNDGLNRYDGYTIKNYKNIVGDNTSISHNEIVDLCEDTLGNIWIATRGTGGLNMFNPKIEKFTRYQFISGDSSSISSNEVLGVARDKSGRIWVCTRNAINLVVKSRIDNKNITKFKRFYNTTNKVSFYKVYENRDGKILFFADKLYYLDSEKAKILEDNITFATTHANSFSVTSVAEVKNGDLWIGTSIAGVHKLIYNSENGNYVLAEYNTILPNSLPTGRCVVTNDQRDRIWIGTQTNGLLMYDEKIQSIKNFVNSECDLNSISENTIQSLFIDRSGILWIGTNSQGINKIDLNRKNFFHYKTIPGDENTIHGDVISSIHSVNHKELWVGTRGGGVNRLIFQDNEKVKVMHYAHDPKNDNSIGSDHVLSLLQRRNGEVWVGTTRNRIAIISPEKPFSKEKPEIRRLSHPGWPFVIFEDSEEKMWIGSWGGGLSRFNNVNGFENFINDPKNPYSICDNVVWTITEDDLGNLWIGGRGKGLSILPVNEKEKALPKFVNFRHDKDNIHSLSSNFIEVMCQDSKGTMWIGTASGLNKVVSNIKDPLNQMDNDQLKITSYHMKDGLPHEHIIGIVEGNNDEIWLSTLNGISKFNTIAETFTNYNLTDGLQSNEFWHNAYFKDSNGLIYFGGNNGFNAFCPDSIFLNAFVPEIAITEIKLFNKSIAIGERINSDLILTESISVTDEIILSYNNNVITFEFAALHYAHPEMNRYAYFLEGFDQTWNNIQNKREVTFTNLNPGEYLLHIKASNYDGIWNEAGKSIKIIILPPWWKTWWFKILSVLIILLFGFLYMRYRTYHLRKQKNMLTSMVEKRTFELEEANTFLEEKQEEISMQNEELQVQKETLQEANCILEEQAEEIEAQNNELNQHRNQLEHLVKERTTNLLAALKKAEESDMLKSMFLSNMSHEIRTPMNAIVGFSSILDDPDITNKERLDFVSVIKKNSNSLLILIDDILQMSQIQANQLSVTKYLVNVIEIFNELKQSFYLQAKPKGINLILEANSIGDTFNCYLDPMRFNQVLSNLIGNAIKFTEKGFVKFGISEVNQESIVFFVQDTGIGIPEDAGNSIFKRFLKINAINAMNAKFYQGIGLGLSISYSIVKALGGDIWYKSKLGEGSCFYFSIPNNKRISANPITIEEKQKKIPNLEDKQILIVEDEETNYQLLEYFLSKTKARLTWAQNGLEALEFFNKNPKYDLILMDLKLPLMDGIEATKQIRKANPNQKIVAQTAFVQKNEKKEYMKLEFDGYLKKPIIFESLITVLNKILL